MDNFTTDGVQLKIGLSRSKSPEDLLDDRGYKSLAGKYSKNIWSESRGVFVLENTTSEGVDTSGRRVVGLDPGVRDVYTSVIDSGDGPNRDTHSVSNSQWAQTQRTKLIRRKDYRWRRETDISGLIDQMSDFHLKTSEYSNLVKGIKLRVENRERLWRYQMRRNRRVYRFSSLLARNSAIDRMADAIVRHRHMVPRSKKRGPKDASTPPIVAFGGGQFRSGGNGLMSVPRKALIKKISYRTAVVIVDEYNTSKMCSCCGNRLCNPDLRPRNNNCPIGPPKTFTKQNEMRLRRCQSEACQMVQSCDDASRVSQITLHRHWNRDVNAAINILTVATEWFNSRTRPAPLRKSSETSNCVETHKQPGSITKLQRILTQQQ